MKLFYRAILGGKIKISKYNFCKVFVRYFQNNKKFRTNHLYNTVVYLKQQKV